MADCIRIHWIGVEYFRFW